MHQDHSAVFPTLHKRIHLEENVTGDIRCLATDHERQSQELDSKLKANLQSASQTGTTSATPAAEQRYPGLKFVREARVALKTLNVGEQLYITIVERDGFNPIRDTAIKKADLINSQSLESTKSKYGRRGLQI